MISENAEPTQKKIYRPKSLFSSLPDEITENILARVSRWNYMWLCLVSKRFCSLLSSMEIYKTRSQIGAEETCFYVCLQMQNQPYPSWFSLWAKPNKTLTSQPYPSWFEKDSSGNSVFPVPFSSSHSPLITRQSTLMVGSEIYIIGGPSKKPSFSVRILDCRNHTWRAAPSMTVAREHARAVFMDEKIYVMGGCDIDEYSANWVEVFDMKTQSWTALPGPDPDDEVGKILRQNQYNIVNIFEGKLYVRINKKEYTYEPKDCTWKLVREQSSFLFGYVSTWCSMKNVTYCCTFYGYLMWSDTNTEGREWREIKGLEILREDSTMGLKTGSQFIMHYLGGKLLVMWDISDIKPKNKIRYAKISLESRCNGLEIWGKVECVDVLTFPGEAYESFYCLTALV